MDNKNLIDMITREVLNTIKVSQEPKASQGPSAARGGAKVLFVFTGTSELREEFYREMERASGLSYDVLMSEGSRSVFDVSEVKSKLRAGEVFTSFGYSDRTAFLKKYDVVVMPFVSLSALEHISSLNTDSMVCNYVVWHMIQKKALIVSAEPLLKMVGQTQSVIMREINSKIAKLSEFGVIVTPISAICRSLEKACSGFTQSGPAPYSAVEAGTAKSGCVSDGASCTHCGHCFARRESAVQSIKSAGAARISAAPGVGKLPGTFDSALASMIDHTLLKPDAKEPDFEKLCEEAARFRFASVCVNPGWIRFCKERLAGSGVMICTVVGFPLGATSTTSKVFETVQAIADGADEIDMVINIGALKSGNLKLVEDDIREVVRAAAGKTVKVILETSLLTDEEKVTACRLSKNANAHFVKTSTGFGGGGATAADISLMRKTVGPDMGVKASGGVRDLETARAMVAAGATRIGASASVSIVSGDKSDKKGY